MDDARTLAACVARVTGAAADDVPDGEGALREWLARRGTGLVPVAEPGSFEWPGHFLGRRRSTGGWIVLFGVPPGVVWDPLDPEASGPAEIESAFVLTTHEVPASEARTAAGEGRVELIALAPAREAPMRVVESAVALAGRGLEGDRYADGAGTFSDPGGTGHDLTLIEAEAIEELAVAGVELAPADARRNLVVRGIELDGLIGRRFRVGEVECVGQRRCEPCAQLERLTGPGVLRGLVHRGGLRADVVRGGTISVGDRVAATRT